jgi:ethanolamine utilization protein EutN
VQLARVIGEVVATIKDPNLAATKLLVLQPLATGGEPSGRTLVALDSVGAGVGETVLVVIEGKAAGDALGKKAAAVDAAVIGIVDSVSVDEVVPQ